MANEVAIEIAGRVADSQTQVRSKRDAGAKHDSLHMMPELENCHCMCPRCWMPTRKGMGICICFECPCDKTFIPVGRTIDLSRFARRYG